MQARLPRWATAGSVGNLLGAWASAASSRNRPVFRPWRLRPKFKFAWRDHGCGRARDVKIIGKNSLCFLTALACNACEDLVGRDFLKMCMQGTGVQSRSGRAAIGRDTYRFSNPTCPWGTNKQTNTQDHTSKHT